jgi:helix-turn-helix protein
MRETIRSGRRENFYVTDNSFIDCYARKLQPVDIAVYHALERYANCHTRSTWVGTAKIAEVLNVSQRTVQRSLKTLEDFKLISILRTSTLTTYFIVPVPSRPKAGTIPLFDTIENEVLAADDDSGVAYATSTSSTTSSVSRVATAASRARDTRDVLYKEEQNLSNKTSEQEVSPVSICAKRLLKILGLPTELVSAVIATVHAEVKHSGVSLDTEAGQNAVVQRIFTAADQDRRRGITNEKFLKHFLARTCAQEIVGMLDLPATSTVISTVAESVKAEAKYTGLSMEEVAERIARSASEDRRKGVPINLFYFQDMKWRNTNGSGKGKNTAERNLDAAIDARNTARRALGLDC